MNRTLARLTGSRRAGIVTARVRWSGRIALGLFAAGILAGAAAAEDFERMRENMVEDQIQSRGVSNPLVLAAMRKVPRHEFVPEEERSDSYEDHPLPIGYGQTISQPYIVAYMCELALLNKSDRVLEVGTGSGYHAAIIGQIVDRVYTMEIVPELAARAQQTIRRLGYRNIEVQQGDGYYGWPEAAPFGAIIVTAAADHVPPPLIRQLAEGGRMVIPLGNPFFVQRLVLVEKRDGKVISRDMLPVRFVPLTGRH